MKATYSKILGTLAAVTLALTLAATAADEPKAGKAKPYPLETCIVTGEKLGGMGEAYVFVHEGQEIKLCCKGCLKAFKKEPAKYLKKLTEEPKK
ncbi:MAG: hypothetical protein WCO56_13950 [Verrucomicrobiota bacterium]